MTLTSDKAFTLTKIINADKDRAKYLLGLSPGEATAQINELGYDFTAEEIKEYGQMIRDYMGGHINDDVLLDVAGGVMVDVVSFLLLVDEVRW